MSKSYRSAAAYRGPEPHFSRIAVTDVIYCGILKVAITGPAQLAGQRGIVVVIDVLRAFTTAAYAFAAGARTISLVTTIEEAVALRQTIGGAELMGEEGGYPIEGFDAPNSPAAFENRQISPRWIQRTSAGTRAARAADNARELLVTSLVCLEATARYINTLEPAPVCLVVSGQIGRFDGGDDRACADHLAARLRGERPDPAALIERVYRSQAAAKFLDDNKPAFPRRDLELATELDRFDFAMVGRREGGQLIIEARSTD